jgi:aminoglycoside phosphotransferase (APT) family kinase protein
MHADEVEIDADLVRALVAAQLPQWSELEVELVPSFGTDNVLYRLGDDMVVRLPLRERTVETLRKERRWLPVLGPALPLRVPVPLAEGGPGGRYPWTWSVYRWLPGSDATVEPVADEHRIARDLAGFLAALQELDTTGGPTPGAHNFGRGEPVSLRDAHTQAAIASLGPDIDLESAARAWRAAVSAPAWSSPPVWIHGDLDRRNLVVVEGRLGAVVDWGCLGVGDPACDVAVAWKVLTAATRDVFRDALSIDEATWARARGWVLSQAVGALSYYTPETNPALVSEARRWLDEVLAGPWP